MMKEKMKMSSIKNTILISKTISNNEKHYNPGYFLEVDVNLLWNSMPLFVRLPMPRFLSYPYFKMLGCRSRADVATLPRRDVETSRCGSHLHALFFIAPKTASTAALFAPTYLYPKQTPNKESKHKNYIINIKST